MCLKDVSHGRLRICKYTSVNAVTGAQIPLVGPDSRRVGISISISAQSISQPQTAGIIIIPRDNGNLNVASFFFSLYQNYVHYRVEDFGSLVLGGFDALSGDANTIAFRVVEVFTNEPIPL